MIQCVIGAEEEYTDENYTASNLPEWFQKSRQNRKISVLIFQQLPLEVGRMFPGGGLPSDPRQWSS